MSCLRKSLNASKLSEHPPDGKKTSKRSGGNIDCKDEIFSCHLIRLPHGSNIIGSTVSCGGLNKSLNASKPSSEHPLDRGEKCQNVWVGT